MTIRILNSKGEPIKLNKTEQLRADLNQRKVNDLGMEINITTLTTIMKKVSEQKFYQIAFADYLPVQVGQGAWSSKLTTYRSFQMGGAFSDGIINQGSQNARVASGDVGVDSIDVPVINWAKGIGWNLMELQQALKAGSWDIVSAKEEERKKNWDLGLQELAFIGLAGTAVNGLLNQSGVTNDTTTLTQKISAMDAPTLSAFCAAVLDKYRANCSRTAWPTAFIIPESDYLGLASPSSAAYPIKSKLEVLQETFRTMTKNANFQIQPLAYADVAYAGSAPAFTTCRYTLINQDEKSIRMDLPVDYTSTVANTIDGFSFQNVAYGQFTGVQAYRPNELYYFSF